MKKSKKLRQRGEALENSLNDLGILTAQAEISEVDKGNGSFMGRLPTTALPEFFELWRRLHDDYLQFGLRD